MVEPSAPVLLDRHDVIDDEPRVLRRRATTFAANRARLGLEECITRRTPNARLVEAGKPAAIDTGIFGIRSLRAYRCADMLQRDLRVV